MFECLMLGDSIAIGAQQFYPTCAKIAKGGINSWQFNKIFVSEDLIARTAIISLGSNDHAHIKTERELLKVRERLKAERVFWILPAGNLQASNVPIEEIQTIVYNIAGKYNDRVVGIEGVQPDGIHPSKDAYKKIVEKVK